MKRVTAYAMAFIMVLGLQSHALCKEEEKLNISNADTLIALSLLDESFDFEAEPLRGDVIKAFLSMIYDNCEEMDDDELFEAAQSFGIIDNSSAAAADKPCLCNEAVKMAVCVLGYKNIAVIDGGYPSGYNKTARRIGILKNVQVKNGGIISGASLTELLYNTATADYNSVERYTDGQSEAISKSGETLLSRYRGIYELKGKVDANFITSLNGKSGLEKNEISIDGEVYKTERDYSDFIGSTVEGYYAEKSSGNKVLYLSVSNKESAVKISSENIAYVADNYSITYYDSDAMKQRKAEPAPGFRVFYNGKVLWNYDTDIFKPKDGEIRLVDTDSDSKYDYAFIMDCEMFVLNNYDSVSGKIYNRFSYKDAEKFVSLDDDDTLVKTYLNGKKAEIEQISPDSVLRIAQSRGDGKKLIMIYASSKVISGKVSGISDEKVFVGDESYKLSDAYNAALNNKDALACGITASLEGEFYIDDRGFIAAVKSSASDYSYGYAIKLSVKKKLGDECQIKLLNSRGVWEVIPISDRVALNGSSVTDEAFVNALSPGNSFAPQLICYRTDDSGFLKKVYTAEDYTGENNNNVFTKTAETRSEYLSSLNSFSTSVYLDSPTVWVIPENHTYDEDDYYVTSLSYLKGSFYYTYTAYDVDEFNHCGRIVVRDNENTVNNEYDKYGQILMIDKIKGMYDSDGNECTALYGCVDDFDNYRVIAKDNLFSGLKRGDIVKVHIDHNGYADKCELLFSPGAERKYADSSVLDSRQVVLKGIVEDTDLARKLVRLSLPSKKVFKFASKPYIYIYKENDGTVQRGSAEDISKDDYAVMRMSYGVLSHIFLIK